MHLLLCYLQGKERGLNGNFTAQNETERFKQPYFNATAKQARAGPFFFTCEDMEGVNGCKVKAPKRANARIRHMRREQSAYSNPTCALHAPFVWTYL